MAASFTTGALAFSRETVVEVPAERETLELAELGLTLILPDSWKGRYEPVEWEGQYVAVCPEVREAALAQARAEWAGGGMEWPEELDRNPFSGGMLFYIFGIPEALTADQLPDSDWGAFAEFTETRCLLAAAERTYLPTCSLPRTPARFTRSWRGASVTSASCSTARWPDSAPPLSGFSGQEPAAVF